MANAVQELASLTPGKESMAMEAFAKALRQLPTIIADNAGYDSSQLISELRALHSKGQVTMGLSEWVWVWKGGLPWDSVSGRVGGQVTMGLSEWACVCVEGAGYHGTQWAL